MEIEFQIGPVTPNVVKNYRRSPLFNANNCSLTSAISPEVEALPIPLSSVGLLPNATEFNVNVFPIAKQNRRMC